MIFCIPILLLSSSFLAFAAPTAKETIELGRIYGFKFCNQLNGSVFDLNSLIDYKHVQPHLFQESSSELRVAASMESPHLLSETKEIFAEALDLLARPSMKTVMAETLDLIPIEEHDRSNKPHPDLESALRFACFSLAEGIYEFAPFVSELRKQRILQFVDNQKYFGDLLSFAPLDINRAQLELNVKDSKTKGYYKQLKNDGHISEPADGKLAFVLMVHKNIENIKEILKDISKAESTVLIHVDGNNPQLKRDLSLWLETEFERGRYNSDLVRIMEKSFKGAWGHSSLVFMQLEAIFELLEMNDSWEYVINMSGYDILLADHETIYNRLREYSDANWLKQRRAYSSVYSDKPHLERTNILAGDGRNVGILPLSFYREAPLSPFVNSQWMILTRSTALRIQQSPSAATYLAHQEFGDVPDEAFMSSLLAFSPFVDVDTGRAHRFSIVKGNLRYYTMEYKHAAFLEEKDKSIIEELVNRYGDVIARKIDYTEQPGLVNWIRDRKDASWTIPPNHSFVEVMQQIRRCN